jgi:RIO kinase 1
MVDALAPLLADGIVDEVLARLKSGKEADIYLVRHGGEVVAAKVYKERHARNFRNNAAYKEGRQVRDTRTQRAMDKGSRFGQAAAEEAWKAKESEALHTLHAAGVRVPRPVLFYEGVLLMEALVDAEGHPAPRLIDAHVPPEHAAELYADLRLQAVKMLACDVIHGDLSPYNVLAAKDGLTLIDFPQVVGAAHNSQARGFFERDLRAIHQYFAAIDPSLRARGAADAHEIWRAYERRELTPDFVPSGRAVEQRGPAQPRAQRPEGAGEHHRQHGGGHPSHAPRAQPPHGGRPAPAERGAHPPRPAHATHPSQPRGAPPAAPPPARDAQHARAPAAAAPPARPLQPRREWSPAPKPNPPRPPRSGPHAPGPHGAAQAAPPGPGAQRGSPPPPRSGPGPQGAPRNPQPPRNGPPGQGRPRKGPQAQGAPRGPQPQRAPQPHAPGGPHPAPSAPAAGGPPPAGSGRRRRRRGAR